MKVTHFPLLGEVHGRHFISVSKTLMEESQRPGRGPVAVHLVRWNCSYSKEDYQIHHAALIWTINFAND